MIDKIRLTDFQKHERLDVELAPTITTLVGPTDAGKSSVFRALRWLAVNRPSGTAYVRTGSKGMEVRAKVDGETVRRGRDGATNLYAIGKKDFKAFGNDVPVDVSKLLGIGEDNFQDQHDAPFWFSLSPPELARKMNELVDLELIDSVTSRLVSKAMRLKAENGLMERRLEESTREAESLFWVLPVDKELLELERIEGELDEERKSLKGFEALLAEIRAAKERASALCPDFSGVEKARKEWVVSKEECDRLGAIVQDAKEAVADVDRNRKMLRIEERKLDDLGVVCPKCKGSGMVERKN